MGKHDRRHSPKMKARARQRKHEAREVRKVETRRAAGRAPKAPAGGASS